MADSHRAFPSTAPVQQVRSSSDGQEGTSNGCTPTSGSAGQQQCSSLLPGHLWELTCKQCRAGHCQSTSRMRGTDQKQRSREGRRQSRAHPHPTLPASSQALVQLSLAQIHLSPYKQRFTHVAVSLYRHLCLCCLSSQLLHSFSLKSSIPWIFPAAEAAKEISWAGLA